MQGGSLAIFPKLLEHTNSFTDVTERTMMIQLKRYVPLNTTCAYATNDSGHPEDKDTFYVSISVYCYTSGQPFHPRRHPAC